MVLNLWDSRLLEVTWFLNFTPKSKGLIINYQVEFKCSVQVFVRILVQGYTLTLSTRLLLKLKLKSYIRLQTLRPGPIVGSNRFSFGNKPQGVLPQHDLIKRPGEDFSSRTPDKGILSKCEFLEFWKSEAQRLLSSHILAKNKPLFQIREQFPQTRISDQLTNLCAQA